MKKSTVNCLEDETHETQPSPNNMENSNGQIQKEHIADLILVTLLTIWNQISKCGYRLMKDLRICELLDILTRILAKHPFLALSISGMIIILTLPFMLFTIFALTTAILTFMGFVMIEGTLITITTVLLFGFLGCVLVVLLFFGGVILTGYFGFMQIYDLFDKKSENKPLINKTIKTETNADRDEVLVET